MRAWPLSRVAGIEDGGSTEPAEGSAVAFDLRCHLAQAGFVPRRGRAHSATRTWAKVEGEDERQTPNA
jgi:hypothetical protein